MRLIDADALDKKMWDRQYPYAQTKTQLYVRKMIKEAPIIDAVPVVHGRWENAGFLAVKCSECKNTFYELGSAKYCPNCGAKMDEPSP